MRVVVFSLVAAAAAGCASPGRPAARPPAAPQGGAETATLPPDEAVRAMAATAAELARDGYDAEAVGLYARARQLAAAPDRWAHELAVLYDRLGDDARAVAEYQKAAEQAPTDPDVYNDFGCFYSARGDWAKAEGLLKKATALKPDHAGAWVNLGVVFAKSNRPAEARAAFATVLTPAEADYNLGVLLAGQGRGDEARDLLKTAAGEAPEMGRPQAVLARLEAKVR